MKRRIKIGGKIVGQGLPQSPYTWIKYVTYEGRDCWELSLSWALCKIEQQFDTVRKFQVTIRHRSSDKKDFMNCSSLKIAQKRVEELDKAKISRAAAIVEDKTIIAVTQEHARNLADLSDGDFYRVLMTCSHDATETILNEQELPRLDQFMEYLASNGHNLPEGWRDTPPHLQRSVLLQHMSVCRITGL